MAPSRPQGGASGNTTSQTSVDATSNDTSRNHQDEEDEEDEDEEDEDEEDEDEGDDDDEDDDDNDDAPASDETNSNYSSVSGDSLPPIRAYGHSYHGSARIYIPNDATEDERLGIQHELYKLCLDGRLHDVRLPVEDEEGGENPDKDKKGSGDKDDEEDDGMASPTRPKFHILDVGSGNGLWAVDAARRYPSADVLGIDLSSALLPKDVPPNLTFEIADAAEPWPPRLYDFIHMRNLAGGGVRNWERLLAEALAHLKPGGALEFSEIRPRFYDVGAAQADLPPAEEAPVVGSSCLEHQRLFTEMAGEEGVDFDPVPRAVEWLTGSEVEGLREREDWLPVIVWGNDPVTKKKGDLVRRMVDVGLENWTMMLFGRAGMDEGETRAMLERVKEETRNPRLQSYFNLTFITARKPLVKEREHDSSQVSE